MKSNLCLALIFSVSFAGCASAEKNGPAKFDETRVQPATAVIAKDAPTGAVRKFSNDCKAWVDEEAFDKQVAVATVKPRFFYTQLSTADSRLKDESRLVQFDSKDRIVVGDNMTTVSQVVEATKPQDPKHHPTKNIQKEIQIRSFAHLVDRFTISIEKMTPEQFAATPNFYARTIRKGTWTLSSAANADQQMRLTYALSQSDDDRADAKQLSSKYAALTCTKEKCVLMKKPGSDPSRPLYSEPIVLTKTSLELSELTYLDGFDNELVSEIDQMCTPSTRTQFVKELIKERDEYAKNCKVILSDDAVLRKWLELCNAYREQLKPVLKNLF